MDPLKAVQRYHPAQTRADFMVLAERGRRVLSVHLKGNTASGLAALGDAIKLALS
jgi:transaldolase/glucose-6-phosphate isomerase